MKITRIDIEGRDGRYATITRPKGSEFIQVELLTPYQPGGKVHRVKARCTEAELWDQARNIQTLMDGCPGTNGDIVDYFDVLIRFTD